MSLEKVPELGFKPVSLAVRMPAPKSPKTDVLGEGIRELYQKRELCDIVLEIPGGHSFGAHRAVLCATSGVFAKGLAGAPIGDGGKQEVKLTDVSSPEAVRCMLDHVYQVEAGTWEEYSPKTQEVNKDVLRLAQNFQLPGLAECAARWLAKDLTTGNVVERLAVCEEFGLAEVRDKIIAQLACNKRALSEVVQGPQIMAHPEMMRALLQQTAATGDEDRPQQKRRRSKVGGS